MKRIIFWGLIFLIFIYSYSLNAYAIENEDKEIIKVGYVPNYTTINEPIEKNYEGYGYEYFKEIEKYTNFKFEFIACTWADGKKMIKSGELDLFGPDGLDTIDNTEFEYTKNNFGIANAVLIAPIEMEIGYNDYQAFDGKRIGVLDNSVYIPYYEDSRRVNRKCIPLMALLIKAVCTYCRGELVYHQKDLAWTVFL